jgi:hypothetical protein
MASTDDVDQVRRMTNISSDDEIWPFAVIGSYIDAHGIVGATATLWDEIAAKWAGLVDVSEAGAQERLGQLSAAAFKAAAYWHKRWDDETTTISPTNARTYAIEREAAG